MFRRLLTFFLAFVTSWACLFMPQHAAPGAVAGGQALAAEVDDGRTAKDAENPACEYPAAEQGVHASAECPADNAYPLQASPAAAGLVAMMDRPKVLAMAALRPIYLDAPQRPPCAASVAA